MIRDWGLAISYPLSTNHYPLKKAVGIIAEYNPFHAGHAYQISQIKKFTDAGIVAIMSGSFTQRGTPAILDKWTRAKLAVMGGVDLVLELPFTAAVRSAQDFARGGVNLLSRLGIIDTLAFGAEVSDLEKLKLAAATFSAETFQQKLKLAMATGKSYAAAVTEILSEVAQIDAGQPNTILAIEYLRALPKTIQPLLIPRGEVESSATEIRRLLYQKNVAWQKISVPPAVLDELKSTELVREDFLLRPILAKILTSNLENLREIYGMAEGIEFKLIESARRANTFDELITGIVNRRFPISRVKRLLLHFLIGFTKEISGDYARVLACNERGRALLKQIRAVPIVTKVAQHLTSKEILSGRISEPYKKNLAFDLRATDLREILFERPNFSGKDFLTPPYFK